MTDTMIQNKNTTYGLGIFTRVTIVTIILLFIMGIASLVGKPIPGLALCLLLLGYFNYIGFIEIWLTLITITFGLLYIAAKQET